mmetsp:Transcript_7603/g.22422  ORF Transcript_7603/g.22422 Transcript_7603/m.22422 type:complete len:283 (+) Transcript_7603:404-1252(+)
MTPCQQARAGGSSAGQLMAMARSARPADPVGPYDGPPGRALCDSVAPRREVHANDDLVFARVELPAADERLAAAALQHRQHRVGERLLPPRPPREGQAVDEEAEAERGAVLHLPPAQRLQRVSADPQEGALALHELREAPAGGVGGPGQVLGGRRRARRRARLGVPEVELLAVGDVGARGARGRPGCPGATLVLAAELQRLRRRGARPTPPRVLAGRGLDEEGVPRYEALREQVLGLAPLLAARARRRVRRVPAPEGRRRQHDRGHLCGLQGGRADPAEWGP